MDSQVLTANDDEGENIMLNLFQHPFRRTSHLTGGTANGMDTGSSPA
jgi:hypothetical protein